MFWLCIDDVTKDDLHFQLDLDVMLRAELRDDQGIPNGSHRRLWGHNSKAVHRAYAKRAWMRIPSLEAYEHRAAEKVDLAA